MVRKKPANEDTIFPVTDNLSHAVIRLLTQSMAVNEDQRKPDESENDSEKTPANHVPSSDADSIINLFNPADTVLICLKFL